MIDEQALLQDLVQAIQAWMQGSKHRSLSSLARRTNVAYSTIRRIAQNESVPHPYTALSIAEVVFTVRERIEFLKKHFPMIGNLMDECYDGRVQPMPIEDSMSRFLSVEPHNRIFNMAATHAGTTRTTLRRLTGDIGMDALDEMIHAGLLLEDEQGRIRYHQDNWAFGRFEDALAQIKYSAGHFQKPLVGTDGASLMHATGAVNAKTVPKLKALIMEFIAEFSALKNAKESEGDIPFYCDLVYSLYDRYDWDQEKENDP